MRLGYLAEDEGGVAGAVPPSPGARHRPSDRPWPAWRARAPLPLGIGGAQRRRAELSRGRARVPASPCPPVKSGHISVTLRACPRAGGRGMRSRGRVHLPTDRGAEPRMHRRQHTSHPGGLHISSRSPRYAPWATLICADPTDGLRPMPRAYLDRLARYDLAEHARERHRVAIGVVERRQRHTEGDLEVISQRWDRVGHLQLCACDPSARASSTCPLRERAASAASPPRVSAPAPPSSRYRGRPDRAHRRGRWRR